MIFINMRLYLLFFLFLLFKNTKFVSAENDTFVSETVNTFEVANITENSIHVLWNFPTLQDIIKYELEAKVLHTFSNDSVYSLKWTFSNNIFRSEIPNLHPATKYNLSIKAFTKNGSTQEMFKIFDTDIAEPDKDPTDVEIIKQDATTMTVKIHPSRNNNGPISFYRLVVMNIDQFQVYQEESLTNYEQAKKDGITYYITADVDEKDINKDFIIGDGKFYNGYYNGPLEKGVKYDVFVGIVSKLNGVTKTRFPNVAARQTAFKNLNNYDNSGLVTVLAVAVVVASILLIIAIITLLLVRRRFYRNRRQRLSNIQELSVQGPMISVTNDGYLLDEELERVNHYDVLKKNVWNIPRDNLQINPAANGDDYLGFGMFGHFVRGNVLKSDETEPTLIACCIITDGDLNSENKRKMLRNLDILVKAGNHENLAGLIGMSENPDNVYIVFEYSPIVLKNILINHRNMNSSNEKFTDMSEYEVFDILIGVANGMDWLSEKKLIHERLCANNVLMFDNVPKITGHGISHFNRHNTALDYTRWTAPEVLNKKRSSTYSDVWSFACLMWEVCSFGATPYSEIDTKDIATEVNRGTRLPRLSYFSLEICCIMSSCWMKDPEERPSINCILQQLQDCKEKQSIYPFLNFNMTPNFHFSVYAPAIEIAEDVCHLSKRTYS